MRIEGANNNMGVFEGLNRAEVVGLVSRGAFYWSPEARDNG